MNPVRGSTSKSCAASVVASTTPACWLARTLGRGNAMKRLGGKKFIDAAVVMRGPSSRNYIDLIFGEGGSELGEAYRYLNRNRTQNKLGVFKGGIVARILGLICSSQCSTIFTPTVRIDRGCLLFPRSSMKFQMTNEWRCDGRWAQNLGACRDRS